MNNKRTNPFQPIYNMCNQVVGDKINNIPIFPRYIDIELTNKCNFTCLMCPTGTGCVERIQGFMSRENFYKILEQVKVHKTPLRFIRWGEPLMHPNFLEFVQAAKKQGNMVHVNTNGSYMNDEIIEELINIPLESIKFSFQGINAKTYKEMRNIDYYHHLMQVINKLYNKRGENKYPYIHISTTITYESQEEVDLFKKQAKEISDYVSVGRTVLDYLDIDKMNISKEERMRLKLLKKEESVVKVHPKCPEVFDKLSINWDGSVTACCSDYDNMMTIGRIEDQLLEEIWQSNKMNTYRKILNDMGHDKLQLCKNCYDYMSLQNKNLQKTD